MSAILVTGGAGFIGSHTCKVLAQAGYLPVSFDNLVYGNKTAVKWGPLEIGDILDKERISCVLKKYKPAAVMHFAAYAYVGESVLEPQKYYHNNVVGSLTLLDAMKRHDVNQLIFSSSCATYGNPVCDLIDEEHPLAPANPYGATKLIVERALRDYQVAYGLEWMALRYFNAAGADIDGEIGEDHDPETHLIPLAIDAAIGKRGPLHLFGSDYETVDGTCVRDYVHVGDLADAHVRALKALDEGINGQALNLGTGTGYSNRQIVSKISELLDCQIPLIEAPRRAGDPATLVARADRARKILGWHPRYSNLEAILKTAIAWRELSN